MKPQMFHLFLVCAVCFFGSLVAYFNSQSLLWLAGMVASLVGLFVWLFGLIRETN